MTKNSTIDFIFGENTFLVEQHVQRVKNAFPDASHEQFKDKVDLDCLFQSISTESLFSSQKLIIIKNPSFLRSISDTEMATLKRIVTQMAGQTDHIVIYDQGKTLDQRKKAVAFLKKNANTTQHATFKDWEQDKARAWLVEYLQQKGVAIDRDAITALEDSVGLDLQALASEVEKLMIYIGDSRQITRADVIAQAGPRHRSMHQFSDAFKNRNAAACISACQCMMDDGDDPVRILGLVTANMRLYIQMLSLAEEGQSPAQIAKTLGRHPYFIQTLLKEVKAQHTVHLLKDGYRILAQTDVQIKTGKMPPAAALKTGLLKILTAA